MTLYFTAAVKVEEEEEELKEDYHLSQFWYDDETSKTLAAEVNVHSYHDYLAAYCAILYLTITISLMYFLD